MSVFRKYSPETIVIEDAAEALGAKFRGKKAGTFGDASIFSFNSNKLITTGGGGIVWSKDKKIIDKISFLSTQAKDKDFYYLHTQLGYNFRMNAFGAAVGLPQLKEIDKRVAKKNEINSWYKKYLKVAKVKKFDTPHEPAYWLSSCVFEKEIDVKKVEDFIKKTGIEVRGFWRPMPKQPLYVDAKYFQNPDGDFCGEVYKKGICLPSDIVLNEEDIKHISEEINKADLTV
jgi:dTDP-4-amino-4,6-dideoxygalactose transaminase